jgi:hypothetical protein
MSGGQRLVRDGIAEARGRFTTELAALPKRLHSLDPDRYAIARSETLKDLSEQVRQEIIDRELG